ncbi:RadC family protein [Vibrio europaeus]|uniref:RadC family protein n=1 Tax=Vibrio europaeus TaxID=300876 RepID=UPI00233ECB45|nr:DNA repair protein RadC [Vibrio europaeus]MDC5853791.1 DNA repair protein RadC [Vibrio europaeus]
MNAPLDQTTLTPVFSDEEQHLLQQAAAVLKSKLVLLEQPVMNAPSIAQAFCQTQLAACDVEIFGALFLDNQHRVRACEELFRGTLDQAAVYPREVVKRAIATSAAAVILFHNHPSGCAEPSQTDRRITRRLHDVLALVDVRLLDHFVVSFADVVSFAERGWL